MFHTGMQLARMTKTSGKINTRSHAATRIAGPTTLRAICIAAVVSLVFSPLATAAGWYTGEIATIQLNTTTSIVVWLNASNNECGSTRVDYVATGDESSRKAILAALLAWQAQQKSVAFYVESCTGTIGKFTDVRNAN